MSKPNLFISHKDKQSIETLEYLRKFENFSDYISVLSIHDNKKLIKNIGIKLVPTLFIDNNPEGIFEGKTQCCLKIQAFINSKKTVGVKIDNDNDNTTKTFSSITSEIDGDFSNIDSPLPMFSNIEEPMNTFSNDLEAQMAKYNNSAPKPPPQSH